jgi:hypothetical protein
VRFVQTTWYLKDPKGLRASRASGAEPRARLWTRSLTALVPFGGHSENEEPYDGRAQRRGYNSLAPGLLPLLASRDDIGEIERAIANNPFAGDVIPGLRGIRKLRFAIGSRGKRGGGRAVYFLMLAEDTAIMLFAYAKN